MSARRRWLLPCAAAAMAVGVLIGRWAEALWPCLVCLGAAALSCVLLRRWGRFAAALALALSLGMTVAQPTWHASREPEGDYLISGVVAEEVRVDEEGHVRTVLRSVTLDGRPLSGGAYWSFYLAGSEEVPAEMIPGCRVTLRAQVYHPGGPENPGGYDFGEYLLQRGMRHGVFGCEELTVAPMPVDLYAWAAACRGTLTQRLREVMGEESGNYAATMLLGCRDLLPRDDRDAFAQLGVAHLLSVSGFHVGVLAGVLNALWRRLKRTRWQRFLLNAVALVAYSFITGFNAPVVRATVMFLLWQLGALCLRQRSGLHIISAAWIAMLAFAPAQLMNSGFQMSFGAMLGLTLITPWMQSLLKPRGRLTSRVWQLLSSGVGAQLGVLLPQLYWYHEFPLATLFANVLLMLVAGAMLTLCWVVLALLAIPPLAQLVGGAAGWLLSLMVQAVRLGSDAIGMMVWTKQAGLVTALGFAILLPALTAWWRRGWISRVATIALGLSVMILSLIPLPHHGTEYIQLAVGSADSAIIHDEDHLMVIDTGVEGTELAAWLHQRRLSIDTLVLTHLHKDHAGGLQALLTDGIPVRRCIVPEGVTDVIVDWETCQLLHALEATGTELVTVARGDVLPLPSGSATVLWPEAGRVRPGQNANPYSMALRIRLHGTTLLSMGDTSGTYAAYAWEAADVIKLAHHGAEDDNPAERLAAASPQMLILTTGNERRSESAAERFAAYPLYDTNRQGAITLHIDDIGFCVTTMR